MHAELLPEKGHLQSWLRSESIANFIELNNPGNRFKPWSRVNTFASVTKVQTNTTILQNVRLRNLHGKHLNKGGDRDSQAT